MLAPTAAWAAGHDWLAGIDGSTRLSQISIPGTHNSGATQESWPGTAKCQNLTIADQLNLGVRLLDIRCRHIDDAFAIHHGPVFQGLSFRDVLDQVTGFLNANPRECVLMSVKEEFTDSGNTRSFEATFDSYVAARPASWWLGSGVPTLDSVRGKIVLLRRFAATATQGIDATHWPDNTRFDANHLSVQDDYQVSDAANKWRQVSAALDAAHADTRGDVLHLTFTSGYLTGLLGVPRIPELADQINPKLEKFFTPDRSGHFGIVLMDFADANRCRMIWQTNFPKPAAAAAGGHP